MKPLLIWYGLLNWSPSVAGRHCCWYWQCHGILYIVTTIALIDFSLLLICQTVCELSIFSCQNWRSLSFGQFLDQPNRIGRQIQAGRDMLVMLWNSIINDTKSMSFGFLSRLLHQPEIWLCHRIVYGFVTNQFYWFGGSDCGQSITKSVDNIVAKNKRRKNARRTKHAEQPAATVTQDQAPPAKPSKSNQKQTKQNTIKWTSAACTMPQNPHESHRYALALRVHNVCV